MDWETIVYGLAAAGFFVSDQTRKSRSEMPGPCLCSAAIAIATVSCAQSSDCSSSSLSNLCSPLA